MNILSNAINALEERDAKRTWEEIEAAPSTIKISTASQDKWVIIHITDNGIGIRETSLNKLFDPFFTKGDSRCFLRHIFMTVISCLSIKYSPLLGSTAMFYLQWVWIYCSFSQSKIGLQRALNASRSACCLSFCSSVHWISGNIFPLHTVRISFVSVIVFWCAVILFLLIILLVRLHC